MRQTATRREPGSPTRTSGLPVSEGVLPFFGGRNSPDVGLQRVESGPLLRRARTWIGGMFWDGRATGWSLGSPLADQARGPFLNPIEMHNAARGGGGRRSAHGLVPRPLPARLRAGKPRTTSTRPTTTWRARSPPTSRPASSTRSARAIDAYAAGARWVLTTQEKRGLALFNGKAQLLAVPPQRRRAPISTGIARGKALFTDYTYDNLGIPQNPAVAQLTGSSATDYGLGGFLRSDAGGQTESVAALTTAPSRCRRCAMSRGRRPTATTGTSRTLGDIVHFYNTRDVSSAGWAAPEVPATVNTDELGDLGLTTDEEAQTSSPSCAPSPTRSSSRSPTAETARRQAPDPDDRHEGQGAGTRRLAAVLRRPGPQGR